MNGKFYLLILKKIRIIILKLSFFLFLFIFKGKALLLLNEDSFKQRSPRCGDILHKALQQHRTMLKSLHCQGKQFHGNYFKMIM